MEKQVRVKKKERAQLPFRLNILFFIVFLLFSILIFQLGVVQILNGQAYQEEIDQTTLETTEIPVPRGKIYDRHFRTVVDNKPMYAITYTPQKGVQAEDRLELAEQLQEYISMYDEEGNLPTLTARNKKEYWYLKNKEEAFSRLTDVEKAELDDLEQYDLILERITEEDLKKLTEKDLEVIAIKRELDQASSLTPHIVKNQNISHEEYARVAEHLDELPGINATTDWDREYPFDYTIRGILGSVTEGILADQEEYYLTRGYRRNDRIGRNGLEAQYEDLLRGRKESIQYTTNTNGQVIDSQVIVEGERGKDLILTIDMEFQARVDDIVREELETAIQKHPYQNRFLEDALAVVMDPKTGDILAISGQHYNREEDVFENAPLKTLLDAHRAGSSVKGASVLAGFQSGVIQPNQVFYDRPVKISGTEEKGSYMSLGNVNDIEALERSSNVYMFFIALRMGGEFNYEYNKSVRFNPDAFQEMRNYFGQFGLGVNTGIDFPLEETGYKGSEALPGLLMDQTIGQYDTFTTIQLAQYVSTIANDGMRMKPRLVKEVREPTPYEEAVGPIYRTYHPEMMNQIQMDMHYIERVQEGFRRVFQGNRGTARGTFANKPYNPAGKTGTAENEVFDENGQLIDTENYTLVGYAPFDDPEIAFAIVVPNLGKVSNQHPVTQEIGARILDLYFDMKETNIDDSEENDEEDET